MYHHFFFVSASQFFGEQRKKKGRVRWNENEGKRRSWMEERKNPARGERRRTGGNYVMSQKMSWPDHPELRGLKEEQEVPKKKTTPSQPKRKLPR